MKLSSRLQAVDPFYVMEMAKAAMTLAASPACDPSQGGEPMVFLNIGEPDFPAPDAVRAAAAACMSTGRTPYTPAAGLPALRRAISGWYATRFGVEVDPARIVVTAGASAALQLVTLALFEAGDEVLMPDPCYPCNRNFVSATGARAVLLPTLAAQRFQPDAAAIAAAWTPRTRGVLLASPSNPTGTSVDAPGMHAILQAVRERGGVLIADEIYLGLSYDARYAHSALALGEDVISVNSFSKYFSMTGWRLGWVVLPPALVEPVERLASNLYICASSLAQQAALACFEPEVLAQCEQRRGELQRRRDLTLRGLARAGLHVPVEPDGAFYAWADCSAHAASSWELCHRLVDQAHVVLTPGRDFGPAHAERHLRLSFASAAPQIELALQRLTRTLGEARREG